MIIETPPSSAGSYRHNALVTKAFEHSPADLVWDRACGHAGHGIGDRHLGALLLVHGMVMNGGPTHAADVCDSSEIAAAAQACRYFGLDPLGFLILELPAASSDSDDEDAEGRLWDAYRQLVPSDSTLGDAFEIRFIKAPEDFDSITD